MTPPGNLPNPGIKPGSPALRADSLPSEPPRKPKNGDHQFKRWILFPTGQRVLTAPSAEVCVTLCSAIVTSCPEPPPCSTSPTMASECVPRSSQWLEHGLASPYSKARTHTHTPLCISSFFFLFPATPLGLWDLHSPTRD